MFFSLGVVVLASRSGEKGGNTPSLIGHPIREILVVGSLSASTRGFLGFPINQAKERRAFTLFQGFIAHLS